MMVVLERDGSVMRKANVVLDRNGEMGTRKLRHSRWLGRFFQSVRRSGNASAKAANGA
jgi:hypothetical protein